VQTKQRYFCVLIDVRAKIFYNSDFFSLLLQSDNELPISEMQWLLVEKYFKKFTQDPLSQLNLI